MRLSYGFYLTAVAASAIAGLVYPRWLPHGDGLIDLVLGIAIVGISLVGAIWLGTMGLLFWLTGWRPKRDTDVFAPSVVCFLAQSLVWGAIQLLPLRGL